MSPIEVALFAWFAPGVLLTSVAVTQQVMGRIPPNASWRALLAVYSLALFAGPIALGLLLYDSIRDRTGR